MTDAERLREVANAMSYGGDELRQIADGMEAESKAADELRKALKQLLLQVEHSYGKNDDKTSYERMMARAALEPKP